jgi:deazaflavin-dependent oxidoreductase (nitroreductase family)
MPESRSRLSTALTRGAARLLRVRWLVRATIGLYRSRLGFVFGSWLLMLEHTGRKTGARRYVVLEVIGRPRPGTYLVGSGFGTRAQWYRNVRADPRVRVPIGGRHRAAATARTLTAEETTAVLGGFAERHPRRWAAVRPVFENILGAPPAGAPMIALELAHRT